MASTAGTQNPAQNSLHFKPEEVLDLKTPVQKLIEISQTISASGGSEQELALFNMYMNRRMNKASLLSNVIRQVGEAMRSIIQNMRL